MPLIHKTAQPQHVLIKKRKAQIKFQRCIVAKVNKNFLYVCFVLMLHRQPYEASSQNVVLSD